MLERLDSSLFDWLTWSAGSISEMFNVRPREECLVAKGDTLRKYAIGWAPAEQIPCRPKIDCIAVMFLTDDRVWWTHLTNREFERIFERESK
jgi:hypothetical protein